MHRLAPNWSHVLQGCLVEFSSMRLQPKQTPMYGEKSSVCIHTEEQTEHARARINADSALSACAPSTKITKEKSNFTTLPPCGDLRNRRNRHLSTGPLYLALNSKQSMLMGQITLDTFKHVCRNSNSICYSHLNKVPALSL